MKRLEGKTAIITGGAKGIGKAIVECFAEEGARVMVVDQDQKAAEELVETLRSDGGNIYLECCDLQYPEAAERVVPAALEHFGKVDILCNNAAVAQGGIPIEAISDDDLMRLVSINLLSAFRLCRAVVVPMRENGGGTIINMCSSQAHAPLKGAAAYAMAKGGLLSLTRQLAVEYGPYNIRCNTISPGTIETPMLEQVIRETDPSTVAGWTLMHPLRRFGKTREISAAAVYLASADGSFANGADFRIDGGSTISANTGE